MTDSILLETDDRVAVIRFNRPARLNAFDNATTAQFLSTLKAVIDDEDVRVIVLTGNGRGFCAGEDLEELGDLLGDPAALEAVGDGQLNRLMEITRCIVNTSKPVIAAVNGVAVGLGSEMAVASDIRIGSTQARFGFVETTRAMFETNGVIHFLPRIVGHGAAMELLLTGDIIGADEALRIGLVNRVVPHEDLMTEVLSLARKLASNAPVSIRLVKEAMKRTYEMDLESMMQLEVEGMRACLETEDIREGIASFAQRREPNYTGR